MPPCDSSLGPADAVVLACAAPQVPDGLPDGVDWSAVLACAERHGVDGLAARAIVAHAGFGDAALLCHARRRLTDCAARNLALTGLLHHVYEALAEAGIAALPFRGPVLGADAFGSLAVRRFLDLDLVVARADARRARRALEARGHRLTERDARILASPFAFVEHHLAFHVDEPRAAVELHLELAPWYFSLELPTSELFAQARVVPVAGHAVRTLAVEHQVIELAAHGSKHGWRIIRHVSDVAATLSAHPELDWCRLLHVARRAGARRMVLAATALARDLLGLPLPRSVSPWVDAEPYASALADRVRRQWFEPGFRPGLLARLRSDTGCRERVRDRVRYCLRGAVEPLVMGGAQLWPPRDPCATP